MANYITTNIRLPEEDYLRLKEEALKKRTSFSAVIREKIGVKKQKDPEELLASIRKLAKENEAALKGVDIVKMLRQMRYHGKW